MTASDTRRSEVQVSGPSKFIPVLLLFPRSRQPLVTVELQAAQFAVVIFRHSFIKETAMFLLEGAFTAFRSRSGQDEVLKLGCIEEATPKKDVFLQQVSSASGEELSLPFRTLQ